MRHFGRIAHECMAIYVSAHEAGLRQTECGQIGQQEHLRCLRIFGVENFFRLAFTHSLYVRAYPQPFQQQTFFPACLFESTHYKHETYNLFVTLSQPENFA
jgi:hypothetical protein